MRGVNATLLSLLILLAAAQDRPGAALERQPTSNAASDEPARPERRPFQPGVAIDWSQPAVYLDAVVVKRRAALEFIASFAGKEHESILRFRAAPEHVFLAIGLIGVPPGAPPRWDRARRLYAPPSGGLVDATLEWTEGVERRTAAAFDWVREFEFARVAIDRPFVFTGASPETERGLAAELAGSGLALVNKSGSLLCLCMDYTDENPALWAEAATERIPPEKTAVTVVLRPARLRRMEIEIDALGEAYARGTEPDGSRGQRRWIDAPLLEEILRANLAIDPQFVQVIRLKGTLRADERAWREKLEARAPDGTFRFMRESK